MKNFLASIVLLGLSLGSTYAITDPAIKNPWLDLYLEASSLERQTPSWFQPHTLASAPTDFSYRQNVLPYLEHRNEDLYLVIPQLGLITPIVEIPKWSNDEKLMTQGQAIDINKYLVDWAIEYVQSVEPWYEWKRIDFAHSNHFVNAPWDFKTIFANLMRLDAGDEARYYKKSSSGQYDLLRYTVTSSYPTNPENVSALRWDGNWADALIFWCYHGLDGRWMIEATYQWTPKWQYVEEDLYPLISDFLKNRIQQAIRKINYLWINQRKVVIIGLRNSLKDLQLQPLSQEQQQIVDFTTSTLLEIYPS